jgi:hypothetical protein
MKCARQVGIASYWLWGGLLGCLASCGSTREVTTISSGPTATSSTQIISATPSVAVVTSRPGADTHSPTATSSSVLTVRPATTVPLPVFHAPLRRPEAEPGGVSTAVPSPRSTVSAVVPARTTSPKTVTKLTRTQSGRVIDEAGQPLVGATVLLKGTAKGASTDADGNYSLEVPLGTNTFIFGYGGYQDEVAESHDGQPLTVTLLPLPTKAKP